LYAHVSVVFSIGQDWAFTKAEKKQITDKNNIRCLIGLDYFKN